LAVRGYVGGYRAPVLCEAGISSAWISTKGPRGRYGGLLFIEKEGFDPLLEHAQIAKKYDLAVMSCKGMSVTAARELADGTCARYKIPLYILHHFDISGFSIAKTVHSTNRRFKFKTRLKVYDMGLGLNDVRGLPSEPVHLGKGDKNNRRATLRANDATDEEIAFLMDDDNPRADRQHGKRVELNALTSRQFIDLIERKLAGAGVRKVIPPKNDLEAAYRLFVRGSRVKKVAEKALADEGKAAIAVPKNLEVQVRAYLKEHPAAPWDEAVQSVLDE
jgi:hypothetical protein